jgi:hypothetical protein
MTEQDILHAKLNMCCSWKCLFAGFDGVVAWCQRVFVRRVSFACKQYPYGSIWQ